MLTKEYCSKCQCAECVAIRDAQTAEIKAMLAAAKIREKAEDEAVAKERAELRLRLASIRDRERMGAMMWMLRLTGMSQRRVAEAFGVSVHIFTHALRQYELAMHRRRRSMATIELDIEPKVIRRGRRGARDVEAEQLVSGGHPAPPWLQRLKDAGAIPETRLGYCTRYPSYEIPPDDWNTRPTKKRKHSKR